MSMHDRIESHRSAQRRIASRRIRQSPVRSWDIIEPCWFECMYIYFSDDEFLYGVMLMSKVTDAFGQVGRTADGRAATDEGFAQEYPVLFEMLTSQEVIEGKPRKVCTMTVVCEDGQWKTGLRERDRDVSLWVSGGTYLESLQALEKALNERPVAWRRPPATDWRSRNRQ